MKLVIPSVSLYREKTVVRCLSSGEDAPALMEALSNRVTLSLRVGGMLETVVVRGKNIASTLRMTALALERFQRDPNVFSSADDGADRAWAEQWKQFVSDYERDFRPDAWVSIYHQGDLVFTTNTSSSVDMLERYAMGGDIDDHLIRKVQMSTGTSKDDDDIVIEHDCQTAIVVTPLASYYRAAILERQNGHRGSFSIISHPRNPERVLPYTYFLQFCADVIDYLRINIFMNEIKLIIKAQRVPDNSVTPAQITSANKHKSRLGRSLAVYEGHNKTLFRPQKPEGLAVS